VTSALPSPVDEATFEKCKLDLNERNTNASAFLLHCDLLRLRHAHKTISHPDRVDGAVVSANAMVLRYFGAEHYLLVVNLGRDLDLSPAPEPLIAAPGPDGWSLVWSSESISYGGSGTPPLNSESEWRIPGEAAVLLKGSAAKAHGSA
jgi:maltooligosyltrehalose trehalohydrolase